MYINQQNLYIKNQLCIKIA